MGDRNGLLLIVPDDKQWNLNELIYINNPLNFRWYYSGDDETLCACSLG